MIVMGKVQNYTITESKNGNPQVAVTFGFQTETGTKTLTWYSSFSGGGKDITLKSLIACGLKEFNRIGELINGPQSNLLDLERDVQLDIQKEIRFDQATGQEKEFEKIQWVNDPALAPGLKTMDQGKWSQFAQVSNLGMDAQRIAMELTGSSQTPSNSQATQQGYNANGFGNQNQSQGAPMQNSMQAQGNMQGAMPMNNAQAQMPTQNQAQMPSNAPF